MTEVKGASTILQYYSGSVVKALIHVYPEVRFDELKFPSVTSMYYCQSRLRLIHDCRVLLAGN